MSLCKLCNGSKRVVVRGMEYVRLQDCELCKDSDTEEVKKTVKCKRRTKRELSDGVETDIERGRIQGIGELERTFCEESQATEDAGGAVEAMPGDQQDETSGDQ